MPPKKSSHREAGTERGARLHPRRTVMEWIEATDEALAETIRDLCIEKSLAGPITFVMPPAEVRASVADDAEAAVEVLAAHVFEGVYANSDAFRRAGLVPTRAGHGLSPSVADGEVRIEGATLRRVRAFRPAKKDGAAVWEVVAGELPLTGPELERQVSRRPGRPGKAAEESSRRRAADSGLRARIAAEAEAEWVRAMLRDRCASRDPLLERCVSLLNFLRAEHPETYALARTHIDRDPFACFFLLFEPYKTRGTPTVPGEVLEQWGGARVFLDPVAEFRAHFGERPDDGEASSSDGSASDGGEPSDEDASDGGEPASADEFKGRRARKGKEPARGAKPKAKAGTKAGARAKGAKAGAAKAAAKAKAPAENEAYRLRAAIDRLRVAIIGAQGEKASRVKTPPEVRKAYRRLAEANRIESAEGVFAPEVSPQVGAEKRLWQDEFRFMTHAALAEIRADPAPTPETLGEAFQHAYARPGNNYADETLLTNSDRLGEDVNPRGAYLFLLKFINSTDFLYVPVVEDAIGDHWGDIPTAEGAAAFGDVMDLSVWNAEASKMDYLRKLRVAAREMTAGERAAAALFRR